MSNLIRYNRTSNGVTPIKLDVLGLCNTLYIHLYENANLFCIVHTILECILVKCSNFMFKLESCKKDVPHLILNEFILRQNIASLET